MKIKKIIDQITGYLPVVSQQVLFKLDKTASITIAINNIAKADCKSFRTGAEKKKKRLNKKENYGKAKIFD